MIMILINPSYCFFQQDHVALDTNPGTGYNNLLLQLIPIDILSAYPHRQSHTLPGLSDSPAGLSNSYPNACVPSRETVCAIFYVFGMTGMGGKPATYHRMSRTL